MTVVAFVVFVMLATWGIIGTIIDNINNKED